MQATGDACHGQWILWLTEIPNHRVNHEELSLSPSGEACWSVGYGFNQESNTRLRWTFDEGGRLLLTAKNGSVISRCSVEIEGDLMTLTPEHGFRSLFARVPEPSTCGDNIHHERLVI